MPRSRSLTVIAVVFLVYSAGQLLQVPSQLSGEDALPALAAFHVASGVLALAIAIAAWREVRWTWVLAPVWGACTAWMVLSLPGLLKLSPEESAGMPVGAGVIAVLATLAAWHFHRSLARER